MQHHHASDRRLVYRVPRVGVLQIDVFLKSDSDDTNSNDDNDRCTMVVTTPGGKKHRVTQRAWQHHPNSPDPVVIVPYGWNARFFITRHLHAFYATSHCAASLTHSPLQLLLLSDTCTKDTAGSNARFEL